VPREEKLLGRFTICWLPDTQAMTAVSTEPTPRVAMNAGIRARVIISQENTPTAAPASRDRAIAAGIPKC